MSSKRRFQFKKVSGRKYLGWKDWTTGDYIVGKYISNYETEYRKQKSTNYELEVVEASFANEDKIKGGIKEGDLFGVNGNKGLLYQMVTSEKVDIGDFVEITYNGKVWIEKDEGTFYHDVSVQVDKNNIDAAAIKEVQDKLQAEEEEEEDADL